MTKRRRAKGEGTIFQRPDGGWSGSLDLGIDKDTGKRRRKTFYGKTKADVTDKMINFRANKDSYKKETPQEARRREDEAVTLHDYADRWCGQRKVTDEVKTYEYYAAHVRLYLKKFFPRQLLLSGVTSQEARDFYGRLLEAGYSPNMISKIGTTLNVMINDAVRDGIIPANLIREVKKPRRTHYEAKVMSEEQINAFLAAARELPAKWFAFFVVMLDTGMRPGELWALRWQDVDLFRRGEGISTSEGTISVRRAVTQVAGKTYFKIPKTKKSVRLIVLSSEAAEVLQSFRDEVLASHRGKTAYDDSSLVFPDSKGGVVQFSNFYKGVYNPTLEKAGIEHLPLYSLRHTSATIMLLLGVSAKVVAERLGHSTTKLTLDVYSHVLPTMQTDAAKKMSGFLSDALGSRKSEPENA